MVLLVETDNEIFKVEILVHFRVIISTHQYFVTHTAFNADMLPKVKQSLNKPVQAPRVSEVETPRLPEINT
jgi:hypothetical protein